MSTDTSEALVIEVARQLKHAPEEWESFTMLLTTYENRFSGVGGWAYGPGDALTAASAEPWALREAVDAYMADHYAPGAPLPVAILVQFERATGRYEITLEDHDELRWKPKPHNYKTLREELRPRFEPSPRLPARERWHTRLLQRISGR